MVDQSKIGPAPYHPVKVEGVTLFPFYDSLGFQCGEMWKDKPEWAALLYMLPEQAFGNC